MTNPLHYPWMGFLYLLTAPSLWGTVICVALLGIIVAVSSILLLFFFALEPQAEAFGGKEWWSWMLAVIACLFEGLIITAACLRVTQSKCQKRIFVETMRAKNCWRDDMVEPSLWKDIHCCKFGLLVKICTFPLNLIPVAGTVVYAFINGPFEAWDIMDMYFDAVGMTEKDAQYTEVTYFGRSCGSMYSNAPYRNFGFMAIMLETIPIIGPAVFSLSNACGAALWACDQEGRGGPVTLRKEKQQYQEM